MNDDKASLIRSRLSQSNDAVKEADVLLRAGMSNRSVMNRLYYAMFYAVLALLQHKDAGTSKHSGAIALFDKEFVKTGIFDSELSKTLHRAFELRQKGDYMEQAEVSLKDIEEIRPNVLAFLKKTEEFLVKAGKEGV